MHSCCVGLGVVEFGGEEREGTGPFVTTPIWVANADEEAPYRVSERVDPVFVICVWRPPQ